MLTAGLTPAFRQSGFRIGSVTLAMGPCRAGRRIGAGELDIPRQKTLVDDGRQELRCTSVVTFGG